jgi:prepilin signal peptidase PulO-like enzyme (type II secretory pathway)
MQLEFVRVLAFLMLLGLAAMFDWKTRKIPDFITCLLWFVVFLSNNLQAIAACAIAFATIWLLNVVFLNVKGREFWGWGDVLIFAPFFAQLYAWGQPFAATMCLVMPMVIGGIRKKQEEECIAPYLFAGAVIAFFFL